MLERTTRSYFEDIITDDFKYIQSNIIDKKNSKGGKKFNRKSDDLLLEEHIMTRKTRTRRPRISALQSGYCAVCNVPYNSVEDHIQSKKHQKLIGEDANYIALNGSLNGFLQTNSIPFLNLNGIDAIGVHDTSLDEFSPIHKKRNARRTRAASVMLDRINPSPLSPTGSDITGHHLRSRRNINYMTPPLEDDSLQEGPDLTIQEEHQDQPDNKDKDGRELRSTTRSLSKLASPIPENHQEEVWNSGRPKRSCISKKRLSADERLNSSCKTYYKVEVVTSKLRTNSRNQEATKRQQSQSPKRDDDKDKGLIVKFKKLRNSELIQLNNEATNFLFPKKDDSSEEDDDEGNTTASSADSCSNIEMEDCKSSTPKVKNEDEGSMDSTGKKKKRRTHAEAFIMDNQKYYKFETPGSRLRYQGSYLPMVMKSPERLAKMEDDVKMEEPEEKKMKFIHDAKVKLDNYKFAFEKIPANTGWYNAFKRLDNSQQSYAIFSNYLWESFLLPYQMRSIPPLDRRVCVNHYQELLKSLIEATSESNSRDSSPEPSVSSASSFYDPDEDSKLSASTSSSLCSAEDKGARGTSLRARKSSRGLILSTGASGKNPRKSPRQHASTLAILSDLVHQRKRRSKHRPVEENSQNLTTIEEEEIPLPVLEEPPPLPPPSPPPIETNTRPYTPKHQHNSTKNPPNSAKNPTNSTKKTPIRKPKIDYYSIAKQIDEELDTALDDDLEDYELEIFEENTVDFNSSKTTLEDILGLYEENNSKETEKSCRRFFNGTPGRKPGMKKRKLNKTGWPNKSKRPTTKKEANKEKSEDDNSSTACSGSVNNSELDDEEETESAVEEEAPPPPAPAKRQMKTAPAPSKRIDRPQRKAAPGERQRKGGNAATLNKNSTAAATATSDRHCDAGRSRVKIVTNNKLNNSDMLQPYVCVQKLDSKKLNKSLAATPKRTKRQQRRMPGSPKSPRMLRKPRGRWYRER